VDERKRRPVLLTFRTPCFDDLPADLLDNSRIVPTTNLDRASYVPGIDRPEVGFS